MLVFVFAALAVLDQVWVKEVKTHHIWVEDKNALFSPANGHFCTKLRDKSIAGLYFADLAFLDHISCMYGLTMKMHHRWFKKCIIFATEGCGHVGLAQTRQGGHVWTPMPVRS